MELLDLTKALQEMDSGKPFSISCVSLDVKRKTGGKKKFYSELVAMSAAPNLRQPPAKRKRNSKPSTAPVKQNRTRKFFLCISGVPTATIIQIHLCGILEVNGKKLAL